MAVHNSGICCHTSILCVGETYWHPYFKKHVTPSSLPYACDFARLVPCHCISVLWTHQFNSWSLACYIHSVYHSLHCSHECFLHSQGTTGKHFKPLEQSLSKSAICSCWPTRVILAPNMIEISHSLCDMEADN